MGALEGGGRFILVLVNGLLSYSGVLIFIIVTELVCVILLFTIREKIDGWLKDPMKSQLKEKYIGLNGTNTVTLTWNLLMTNLHCCGVDNHQDFEHVTGNITLPPEACCLNILPCSPETANNSKGCYAAVEDWLNEHLDIVIGTLGGICGLEVVLLFLSCLTFCATRRSRKTEDNQNNMNEVKYENLQEGTVVMGTTIPSSSITNNIRDTKVYGYS